MGMVALQLEIMAESLDNVGVRSDIPDILPLLNSK